MVSTIRFLMCIFLCSSNSLGELFFPNLINYQTFTETPISRTRIYNMVPGSDNGFVLSGQSNNNDFLLKLDIEGKKEWIFIPAYAKSSSLFTASTNVLHDKCYIFASISRKTLGVNNFEDSYRLTKLNNLGELEWEKAYPCTYKDELCHVIEMDDGGFLLGGNTLKSTKFGFDIQLYRTDREGNLIAKKNIVLTTGDSRIFCLQKMLNGNVLALTMKFETAERTCIINLNNQGDTLWTKTLYYHSQNRLTTICPSKDGTYICGGMSTSFAGKNLLWAVKIDSSANIIWSKNYQITSQDTIKSISPVKDGTYVFAGSASGKCVLMKINENGDSLWSTIYKTDQHYRPSSIAVSPEGRYAIGGTVGFSSDDYYSGFFLEFENESKSIKPSAFNNWKLMDKVTPYDNCVVKAIVDSSNRLWVALRRTVVDGPAVYFYNNGVWKEWPDITKQQITNMVTLSDSTIWISGDLGVYRISDQKTTLFKFSSSTTQANNVIKTGKDSIIICSTDGMYTIQNNSLVKQPGFITTSTKEIYSVYEDKKSHLWYAPSSGLYIQNDTGYIHYTSENAPLPFAVVTKIYQDFNDNIFLISNIGLIKYSNNKWSVYDTANSVLPSGWIYAFASSAQGMILVGGSSGFVDINANKLYTYNNSLLPTPGVNCIAIDKNNVAYIGTDSGLVMITIKNNQLPTSPPLSRMSLKEGLTNAELIIPINHNEMKGKLKDSRIIYYNLLGKSLVKHNGTNVVIKKRICK